MRRREFIGLLGGSAVAWPLAARAQQSPPGRVTLGLLIPVGIARPPDALLEALGRLGYQQGKNLMITVRAARDTNAELPGLAAELVKLEPDVLVSFSTPAAEALKNATAVIPIVMISVGDPIKTGLIQSLAHPGGNVTGIATAAEQVNEKRLQMVAETLPGTRCLLVLRNPANQSIMAAEPSRKNIGEKLGLELKAIDAATPEQLDQVLSLPLDERCKTALYLPLDGLFIARRQQIADFALRQKIALFAPFRADAEAGALVAFGINLDGQWRLGATYIDQILKGAKPADLPVQQPVKFDMVINLQTAKAIGVDIPTSLLLSADEVIE
jgi:putative tryptophan/tyrosine transport system substrate-binding protein